MGCLGVHGCGRREGGDGCGGWVGQSSQSVSQSVSHIRAPCHRGSRNRHCAHAYKINDRDYDNCKERAAGGAREAAKKQTRPTSRQPTLFAFKNSPSFMMTSTSAATVNRTSISIFRIFFGVSLSFLARPKLWQVESVFYFIFFNQHSLAPCSSTTTIYPKAKRQRLIKPRSDSSNRVNQTNRSGRSTDKVSTQVQRS